MGIEVIDRKKGNGPGASDAHHYAVIKDRKGGPYLWSALPLPVWGGLQLFFSVFFARAAFFFRPVR
jgi:hypothetical protein